MPETLYAFDIGTTGVKAGALTPSGQLIGTTYREYPVLYPGPQWVEQSVETIWKAQCEASQELVTRFGIDPQEVAGIAISSQRATFVPLDENEEPLTNYIGWQDKRSIEECETIREVVGAERYYQIAGLPVEPTAAVSKILWLKEHAPEVFERAHVFGSTQNLHLRQLGVENAPCDLPDAAYLGLLDVDELVWSDELLGLLEIPREKMPELVPSSEQVGELAPGAAEALGLIAGTPLVTAGGDLQCAGLGMGVAEAGLVSVGIGTGGGVLIYLEKPLRHPDMALNCLPHAIPDAWEMEGICLASGAAYKWYRDVLGQMEQTTAAELDVDAYELLNEEASQAEAGAGGIIVMPSLVGAGAPNWYPKARGVILGLTLASDKKSLTRAMLEGICLEIRWMLEAAKRLGTQIEEVRIWGGAAKSRLWNQIAADVYGVPAAKTSIPEAGLVGAAICAGVGVGLFSSPQEGARSMVRVEERYEPNPGLSAKYDEMFSIYKSAYQALVGAGVFERIAEL
jgi:xylulokinase